MPLTAKCVECQESFTFPALEKDSQSGRCPECEYQHKVKTMTNDINSLQAVLDSIRPTLCELNTAKHEAKAAYEKAESAWEDLALKHAMLNKKIAMITHEKDLLTKTKEVQQVKKSGKPAPSPEDKALKALKNLPPNVQAAIIQQLKETKS